MLRSPLPSAQELSQQAFQAHSRQDLPSIGEWAPPEHSFTPILASATTYDPMHPPRLNPLQQSVLTASTNHVNPWEPGRALPGTGGLSAVRTEYALPAPSAHWPPPPHYPCAQTHHLPAGGYFYYQNMRQHEGPQHAVQPQHSQVQGQAVMQIPHYSIPSAVHQTIISPVPPPLELPLPVPRGGGPPPALGAKVPSVHELPALKDNLPAIDSKYPPLKDSLAMRAQERAVLSDHAVSKVPDILPPFGNALSKADQTCVSSALASSQMSERAGLDKGSPNTVKKEKGCESPRAKRGRGIADLMNPTDTLPGQGDEPGHLTVGIEATVGKSGPTFEKVIEPMASRADPKPDDLAKRKGEGIEKIEEPKSSVSVTSSGHDENKRKKTSPQRNVKQSEKRTRITDLRVEEKHEETSSEEAEDPAEGEVEGEADEDEEEIHDEDEDDEYADSEETRCPCGSTESSGFMIACDKCNTWQHGECMGYRKKVEVPEKYYCNICRPEEMLPTCVAYRKYKERQHSKDRDGKDAKRDPEVLLAIVKPVELRRHFVTDIRQKKNGHKLSRSDLFNRYALLLRNHFAKHRQSIVEGLVIILDMHRREVVDRLDSTLKRLRSTSSDRNKDDGPGRKRGGTDGSQDGICSDAGGSRSHGHVRVNPQKRARSSSVSLDGVEKGFSHGELNFNEAGTDIDGVGTDCSSGRGLSREDRKLQQAMKLFARMEERERERKKPRTGDSGTSPKVGQINRPKTVRQGTQAPSPSPRSAHSNPSNGLGDESANIEMLGAIGQEVGGNDFALQRNPQKQDQDQPRTHPQQTDVQEQFQSKLARKSTGSAGFDAEMSRDGPKRERDQKLRDKSEKTPSRRKDSSSLDLSLGANTSRRRSILDRERLHDAKKRRALLGTRGSDQKAASGREEAIIDPSLSFRLFVVGPTVLGSRRVPLRRLSLIERERMAAEDMEFAMARESRGFRKNRKEWIREMAALVVKRSELKKQSPVKKRFKLVGNEKKRLDTDAENEEDCEQTPDGTRSKTGTFSVSMVVVSEKQNLPDKGQMLESSRLIIPNTKNGVGNLVAPASHIPPKTVCLKKRVRLRSVSNYRAVPVEREITSLKSPLSSPRKGIHKFTTFTPSSPQVKVPMLRESSKSPALRSSPPRVSTGLRSASSPKMGMTSSISSPASPPQSLRTSSTRNLSNFSPQKRRCPDLCQFDPVESSASAADSKSTSLAEKSLEKAASKPIGLESTQYPCPSDSNLLSNSILVRSVPLALGPKTARSPVLADAGKLKPSSNGLGLRSIRSVPISGIKQPVTSANGTCPHKDPAKENSKAESPQPSPRKIEFSSGTAISDIFQQRLEGFLKPKSASAEALNSSKNGTKPPSSSPRTPNGTATTPASIVGTGTLRAGNGFSSSAMPNFRSKPLENGNHWRPGNTKRSLATYPIVRVPGPTGPPIPGTGRGTHQSLPEKARFRGGRVDPTSRSDENLNNRHGTVGPWNNYTSKSGWVGGGGRVNKTTNESIPKANHKERN